MMAMMLLPGGLLSLVAQAAPSSAAQHLAVASSDTQSSGELSYQTVASDAFNKTWGRTDKLVASSQVNRTWMWGPQPNTGEINEPYQESPGGQRTVEYFDKSRMEITNPDSDPNSIWYVTNGLLAKELITGQMQVGDSSFEQRSAAQINVAGDANDPNGPTYATFNTLMGYGAIPNGWIITQTVDRTGTVAADTSLSSYGVSAIDVGAPTKHNVASVFWDFMNSSGPVYQNGQTVTDKLFQNAFYATGYPLTEAYWTHVLVGGVSKLVLVQVFERRVLTYTPSNPDGWKVEAGNVGQHYYAWRYGALSSLTEPSADRIITDPVSGVMVVKDELDVMLDIASPQDLIQRVAAATGGTLIGSIADLRIYQLRYSGNSVSRLDEIQSQIQAIPGVTAVDKMWLSGTTTKTPNDPKFDQQWGLEYINAPAAWDTTTGKSSVRVGILDGGFDTQQEDLKPNITMVETYSDARASAENDTDRGHGTHVAGIACARGNNGVGISGVAWDCSLELF